MSFLRTITVPLILGSLASCVEMDPDFGMDEAAIVGGSAVDISDFPYQVSLQDSRGHYCGGAILSEKWIITATHCVVEGFPGTKVVAGMTNLSAPESGQTVNTVRAVRFPGYTDVGDGKDFTLVELSEPLQLNGTTVKAIRPLSQTNSAIDAPAAMATVSGWGDLSEGGSAPDVLQAVQVPIVTLADATADYGQPLTPDQLAAGFRGVGGKDACQGDSGGPLVATDPATNEVFLVGVVSWGAGCASPEFPGMYARVSSFTDFIEEYTGGPPTAVAEGNESAIVNEDVVLDGQSSTDSGAGTIVSYTWTQTEGDTVALDANIASPTFTAPSTSQQLTFELTVEDNSGQKNTDSVTIAIRRAGEGDGNGNGNGEGEEGDFPDGDVVGGCSTSNNSAHTVFALLIALLFWRRRRTSAYSE